MAVVRRSRPSPATRVAMTGRNQTPGVSDRGTRWLCVRPSGWWMVDPDRLGVVFHVQFDADALGDGVGGDLQPLLDRVGPPVGDWVAGRPGLVPQRLEMRTEFNHSLHPVIRVGGDPEVRVPGDVENPKSRLGRAGSETDCAQHVGRPTVLQGGGGGVGQCPPLRRPTLTAADSHVPGCGASDGAAEAGPGGKPVTVGTDEDQAVQLGPEPRFQHPCGRDPVEDRLGD